jgi:DNA repair protein RecO (recombination protein O)
MPRLKTEGIILHALDFRDYDQILTVFTPLLGIQKFVYRGNSPRRKGTLSSPLTHGEFIYDVKNSDLLACRELSVFSHFQAIRKDLETLEMACEMAKAILVTQLPGKPAPLLYLLFLRYLFDLSNVSEPRVLAASLFLKILRHDGHMGAISHCSLCQKPLDTLFLKGGESFCQDHASKETIFFNSNEYILVEKLLFSQSLSELGSLDLPEPCYSRVKTIFEYILLAG